MQTLNQFHQETNIGKSDDLKNDCAIKEFLSKSENTEKGDEIAFKDYPPSSALVRASILDYLKLLGIKL